MATATITSPAAFRSFILNFTLHEDVHVQVIQRAPPEFNGLRIAMMTTEKDVLCEGDFACVTDVSKDPGPVVFKLNVKMADKFLKHAPNDTILHMSVSDSHLLRMWYVNGGVEQLQAPCGMPEKLLPYKPVKLKPISNDYILSAPVHVLRKFSRIHKIVGSEALSIVVRTPPHKAADQSDTKPADKPDTITESHKPTSSASQDNIVMLEYSKDGVKVSRIFHRTIKPSVSAASVSFLEQIEEAPMVHKSCILQAHLSSFIKNMNKDTNIEIGLSQDNPVVLQYHIGTPGSFLRYVVAAIEQ